MRRKTCSEIEIKPKLRVTVGGVLRQRHHPGERGDGDEALSVGPAGGRRSEGVPRGMMRKRSTAHRRRAPEARGGGRAWRTGKAPVMTLNSQGNEGR